MMTQVITNNQPRPIFSGCELTAKERAEFDWMENPDEYSFFRYRGTIYALSEFMPAGPAFPNWHGLATDTYYNSGVLFRIVDDGESVIVGRYYS